MGDAIFRAYRPVDRLSRWKRIRKEQQEVREYIPHMTDHDKSIIGYLLHHNQKMFQHEIDGGYAAPLISKGIIRMALRAGQAGEQRWVPFEVPDHVWTVLVTNKAAFPYEPPRSGQSETFPWAIHWMVK